MTTGALDGVRVLELGTLISGPFAGQLLGDFGAEVIKIEQPDRRRSHAGLGAGPTRGLSLWWSILARNKKSVTLDLRRGRQGRELLLALISTADVMLENFRPGTLEKWEPGLRRSAGTQ